VLEGIVDGLRASPRARVVVAFENLRQREKTYFIGVFAHFIFSSAKFRGRDAHRAPIGAPPREGARGRDPAPFGFNASLSGVAVFFVVL
jgi:hypothetical protein